MASENRQKLVFTAHCNLNVKGSYLCASIFATQLGELSWEIVDSLKVEGSGSLWGRALRLYPALVSNLPSAS